MDLQSVRNALLDQDRGFAIVRGFYAAEEVDRYRQECEGLLHRGKVIHAHVFTSSMPDYVFPRSHDQVPRTYRIYNFPHNHRHTETGRFLQKTIDFRDNVESAWANDAFRRELATLRGYSHATYYLEGTGLLPKHVDYQGKLDLPQLQAWVVLVHPGRDYTRGNLVLYSKTQRRYKVEDELGARKGDLLLFDKSLPHEVEATAAGTGSKLGRWTVIIGRRATDPPLAALYRRMLYSAPLFPVLRLGVRAKKALKRLVGREMAAETYT